MIVHFVVCGKEPSNFCKHYDHVMSVDFLTGGYIFCFQFIPMDVVVPFRKLKLFHATLYT